MSEQCWESRHVEDPATSIEDNIGLRGLQQLRRPLPTLLDDGVRGGGDRDAGHLQRTRSSDALSGRHTIGVSVNNTNLIGGTPRRSLAIMAHEVSWP